VRARCQGRVLVKEFPSTGDDGGTPDRVVAARSLTSLRLVDDVRAVQRIVQRAPAGVGRVDREACIQQRNHQLGPGNRGDFGVNPIGGDSEILRFICQVADRTQELFIHLRVRWPVRTVELVELLLQPDTCAQQLVDLRREFFDQRRGAAPKCRFIDARARQCLVPDEDVELFGNVEAVGFYSVRHDSRYS
jgi:hypothetical protein